MIGHVKELRRIIAEPAPLIPVGELQIAKGLNSSKRRIEQWHELKRLRVVRQILCLQRSGYQ